jgi:hypothetical protein
MVKGSMPSVECRRKDRNKTQENIYTVNICMYNTASYPILPSKPLPSANVAKKKQRKACDSKNQILIFVSFLKPKRRKISALNDFLF